jgi:hypothetical protein
MRCVIDDAILDGVRKYHFQPCLCDKCFEKWLCSKCSAKKKECYKSCIKKREDYPLWLQFLCQEANSNNMRNYRFRNQGIDTTEIPFSDIDCLPDNCDKIP